MNQFQTRYGEWAIVTGASSGLGEAFAHVLASRGVRLLLVARRRNELRRVAADVTAQHDVTCDILALDVADSAFIDTLIQACANRDIGLVIGNAAINPVGEFLDMPQEMLMRILNVNNRANLLLANAFLPRLKARGRGGLLFVASVEAFTGTPFSACYSASKAFILSLGEALWGEFIGTGIDVTVLAPGATDTPLLASRNMVGMKVRAMSPLLVAQIGLDRLGRGPVAVPGARNRWNLRIVRRLPRAWLVRKMAPVVRKMVAASRRPAPDSDG